MPEKEEFFKKEIESHSSALTNQRVADLLHIASKTLLETYSSKPDPLFSFQSFSAVMVAFLNTHTIYTEIQNKDIKEQMDLSMEEGFKLMTKMRLSGKADANQSEQLNEISVRLYYLMNSGLQNLRYLFRTSSQEPKGIDAALKIFNLDIWKKKEVKKDVKHTETIHREHAEQSKVPA